ncbi:MAG TPA: PBP1A family penicillin-binding protein [Dissulfurispiraceae bacterium]|nr:PBP1A family penicillin-binding protein [Dissulfurispiraceae bacterium]
MSFLTNWKVLLVLAVIGIVIGAGGGFAYWMLADLPEVKTLETYRPIEATMVYSADNKVLAEFYLERRNFVPHYQIPDRMKKAIVAIEDQRFYLHPGVDIIGILRALYKDIMARKIVEGGSTITQQLTKMLFLKPEKSVARKIKEALISLQIEKRYTKDEILGMYLNQAYFGAQAYGIEAAAQSYFGKSVGQLTLGEAAMVAGLPKAPSQFSPFRSPEKAKFRRSLVLNSMLDLGYITKAEYDGANREPLPAKRFSRRYEAPYFVEFLRQQIEAKYGDKIYISGMKIYATVDFSLQKHAEAAVKHGISAMEKRVKKGVQVALIALDVRTGQIRAMVGGTDFWETQFNRATQAMRQSGSAFKPFVYATALENGMKPEDTIRDAPISFPGGKQGSLWSPRNYDGEFRGEVTLRKALALSLNVATVRLANHLGIDNVIEFAQKCGYRSKLQPYLPTALGASDVTPLDLTAAYAVFATGRRLEPLSHDRVLSRDGIQLDEVIPQTKQVLPPETVDGMRELLREVIESGTAMRAKELKRTVYGKTGTTNDFTDAWFVGFDDRLVVGVWVGRDNNKPLGVKETGARAALPIWLEFMKNTR